VNVASPNVLLNDESLSQIEPGHSTLVLIHAFDNYRTVSPEVSDLAMALDEM
jgi:hypothetical protein